MIRVALLASIAFVADGFENPVSSKSPDPATACISGKTGNADCPNDVEIVGSDYAFTVPITVKGGRATFRFVNHGKVRHELNITRLRRGVSIDEFLDSVRQDKSVQKLSDGPVGVLFAQPGRRSLSGLSIDLTPGERYAVICIFRDKKDAKRHYDLGMYKLITIEGAKSVAGTPQRATDTVVATDYAFQYPRNVSPGKHTFVFRNNGKMRHEFAISLLKKGVTLTRVRELEKTGANLDSLFEEDDYGLLHARTGVTALGELTMTFLPGREYVIVCFFKDTDKSPPHYNLGMFGSIQVSPKPST
ncbi:MAG: hypothetical protein ABIQ55_11980 [Gemmatimonadaceae bacterium]